MFKDKLQRMLDTYGVMPDRFCHELNISRATLRAWLEGKRAPYPCKLKALSAYFGIDPQELLDGSAPKRGSVENLKITEEMRVTSEKYIDQGIRAKLTTLAEYRGIPVDRLPEECDITYTDLRMLLRGTTNNLQVYQTIANYFKVPVWVLLCRDVVDFDNISTQAYRTHNVANVGRNLRCLHAMQGGPVSAMAQSLQITQPSYRKYEAGTTVCSVTLMQRMCAVFHLTAEEVTSDLTRSDYVHDWFERATPYQRLIYLKTMRGVRLGDLAVEAECRQSDLVVYYRENHIPERVANGLARTLNVPLGWVYEGSPSIRTGMRIR